jgi:hypothetical protein
MSFNEFVDQEQENTEYEAGVQSEEQNAFEQSKRETEIRNDSVQIEKLRKKGRFVLVSEGDVHCSRTDAFIGRSKALIASAVYRDELVARMNGQPESAEFYILEGYPLPHKHYFAPGYQTCDCGAARCSFTISGRTSCDKVATQSGLCRRHQNEAETEKEAKRGFWTADRINEILANPDKTTTLENGKVVKNSLIIYRFLQRMTERQTSDEQASQHTKYENGIGFAAGDARLLTDMSNGSLKFNTEYKAKYGRMNIDGLTVRQARYAASRLKKYVKTQLVDIANEATNNDADMPSAVPTFTNPPIHTTPEAPAPASASVEHMVELKRVSDPENYFMDGEMSPEVAKAFWTKRYTQHPMTAHEIAELEGK